MSKLEGSKLEVEILSLMKLAETKGIRVTTICGPSLSLHGTRITQLFGRNYYVSPTGHVAVG